MKKLRVRFAELTERLLDFLYDHPFLFDSIFILLFLSVFSVLYSLGRIVFNLEPEFMLLGGILGVAMANQK